MPNDRDPSQKTFLLLVAIVLIVLYAVVKFGEYDRRAVLGDPPTANKTQ